MDQTQTTNNFWLELGAKIWKYGKSTDDML